MTHMQVFNASNAGMSCSDRASLRRKLCYESVLSDAEDWFYHLSWPEQQDIFLRAYMRKMDIGVEEIAW